MTAQELADQTGLSLEEAELVLAARRARAGSEVSGAKAVSRLTRALEALNRAEKKVGVSAYNKLRVGLGDES